MFTENRQIRVRRALTVSHSICHTMSAPTAPEFWRFLEGGKYCVNINIIGYLFEICWWGMVVNGGSGRASLGVLYCTQLIAKLIDCQKKQIYIYI